MCVKSTYFVPLTYVIVTSFHSDVHVFKIVYTTTKMEAHIFVLQENVHFCDIFLKNSYHIAINIAYRIPQIHIAPALENCNVDFYWDYPEDCLGVFGVLAISEDENGVLNPNFQFIDARDNSVIYQRVLQARYGPDHVPESSTPKPSTAEPSSSLTPNFGFKLFISVFSVLACIIF